ncbi:MAG: DUF1499 domain-containing protein [Octadecabacter sp.]|nr:DUF1499 domain-containing protein [Octadecabacter sp.]
MILKSIVLGALGLAVAGSVFVRLAPIDLPLIQSYLYAFGPGNHEWRNGYQVVRELEDPIAAYEALDAIIMATPRTTRAEGVQGAYVTRSVLWGFPDVTTLYAGPDNTIDGGHGPMLRIEGRAVYGVSDMGVNKTRITDWLAQLDGDTPTQ